ncbi:MAG: ACT domain-containing protein [Acidimicrobiia bacterium]
MARDLTVMLDDRPGALADMGEALGRAGVNIEGICGVAGTGGRNELHILVADADAARSALGEAGIEVGADVGVVSSSFEDRPGELGAMARRIADTGTNIELVYVSCDRHLILATSDNAAVEAL